MPVTSSTRPLSGAGKGTRIRISLDQPPHARDLADYEDSLARRRWGIRIRAAFYAELPPTPLGRVTHDQARLYLDAVVRAIENGHWSTREREKLRVIRRRWEKRVRGEDRRFNALGGVFAGQKGKTPADPWAELRKEIA